MGMEWVWNGCGMGVEWAWNGCGMTMEWVWNDHGMGVESTFIPWNENPYPILWNPSIPSAFHMEEPGEGKVNLGYIYIYINGGRIGYFRCRGCW